MSDRAIVEQLAAGRRIVDLTHARHRTEGVIGALWRDGAAVAICAHRAGLTALPSAIGSLARLARLDVGDNQLTELPALPASLRELYVYDNQLARLPRLPRLPRLSVLDANRNRLEALPALTGIDFVYLAANRLTALPPITSVRYLNVGQNPLGYLALADPAIQELRAEEAQLRTLAIEPLVGLRELSLRGNLLEALPPSIGSLERLEALDLRGNQLDELPEALRALPLTKLDLRWNPLRNRPPWIDELANRGCRVYL
jgi:leucine-rich repeat protein SHOC2